MGKRTVLKNKFLTVKIASLGADFRIITEK